MNSNFLFYLSYQETDNFKPHTSLKLSSTDIWGLPSNFVECESFLESNSPCIFVLCETNLDDSLDSGKFSEGFSSFNLKRFYYSYTWSCFLCKRRTSFYCTGINSRKLCWFLLLFSTGFTSFGVFSSSSSTNHFLHHYAVFDSISSNIDEFLSINLFLTEKSVWKVYFKYILSMLPLYFRSLKSNRSVVQVNFLKRSINEV